MIASPTTTTNYTVHAITNNGDTIATDEVKVEVVPNCDLLDGNDFVITFAPSQVVTATIDDKSKQTGSLAEFVSQQAIDELSNFTKLQADTFRVQKVYKNLTTEDTVTLTRSGRELPIPKRYYSTLVVRVPADSISNLESLVAQCGCISAAEPVSLSKETPDVLANDYLFNFINASAALSNHNSTYENADVNVPDAWDYTTGDSRIKVGVYDTGILSEHDDFQDANSLTNSVVTGGWDWVNSQPINQAHDYGAHGTPVAGIIGAVRNNTITISGIAGGDYLANKSGVQLFNMKVLGAYQIDPSDPEKQQVDPIFTHEHANAILEGAAYNPNTGYGYGLHITNHSYSSSGPSGIIHDALIFSAENDVTFVASRGNARDSRDPLNGVRFPASYPDHQVIAVGASGNDGVTLTASRNNSFGQIIWSSYVGKNMDFLAPGSNSLIYSLKSPLIWEPYRTDLHTAFNGTSCSAPIVSGIAALMQSYNLEKGGEWLTMEDVEFLLQKTATDIGPIFGSNFAVGYDEWSGWGRVNAGAALAAIEAPIYKVRHFESSATQTELISSGFEFISSSDVQGLSSGYYQVLRYKVKTTIQHNLNQEERVIDVWPLKNWSSASDASGAKDGALGGYCFIEASDQTSTTISGYVYHIVSTISGSLVDIWQPSIPFEAKLAFAIRTENINEVGIEEAKMAFNVQAYPNPFNTVVTIKATNSSLSSTNLEVYDLNMKIIGQYIMQKNEIGQFSYTLNLSSVSKGVYFAKISTDEGLSKTIKLVKY